MKKSKVTEPTTILIDSKGKAHTYKMGDVTERDKGQAAHGTWNEDSGEYGSWIEVTIVKKIVNDDKEDAVYFETARRYTETGKTTIRRAQQKQSKYLCVNGPRLGQFLTSTGDKSDPDYNLYNCGGGYRGSKTKIPSAVLVHVPSIV